METSGKTAVQIARELGVSDSVLYHWRKILAEKGAQAFPSKGHQTEAEEELRRLRMENERLRMERDILKKAIAIFTQNQK
ncbi:MAG: transposase [Chloroflexi bacterium]|uniref:Transposase n=1 Tax=Candidatus Chlorohelix allophototropha TaxID=3003348 RepID=A0A8T7M609_9CHLR|nr:transposase [Chloroflexota bacterium]WJW69411.1 transposase [Chloroflexota bacterium L227-S17]